jgi:hypothetical protein
MYETFLDMWGKFGSRIPSTYNIHLRGIRNKVQFFTKTGALNEKIYIVSKKNHCK